MNKEMNSERKRYIALNRKFEIFAHSRDGWHMYLKISKSESIFNLKQKFEERKDFPHGFKLAFQGTLLEDDKVVGDYSIKDGSSIDIIERGGYGIKIHVETVDKKTFGIDVDTDETVASMKMKIGEKIGLVPEEQKLWFEGVILDEDARTLDECGIGPQSEIIAVSRLRRGWPMYIVASGNRNCTIAVDVNETIAGVKMKIGEKTGLAPEYQTIFFQGGTLENEKTLDEYLIWPNAVLFVKGRLPPGLYIFIKTMNGRSCAIEIFNHETVWDLKKQIHRKLRIAPEDQRLVCQGEILQDEGILDEYEIPQGSTIHLVFGSMCRFQIFIRVMGGEIVALKVMKYDTIRELKKQIHEIFRIPLDKQRLEFQGAILDDDERTLNEVELESHSQIQVLR